MLSSFYQNNRHIWSFNIPRYYLSILITDTLVEIDLGIQYDPKIPNIL